jgi:hypothetical protein
MKTSASDAASSLAWLLVRQRRIMGHWLEQGLLTRDDQPRATTARLQDETKSL